MPATASIAHGSWKSSHECESGTILSQTVLDLSTGRYNAGPSDQVRRLQVALQPWAGRSIRYCRWRIQADRPVWHRGGACRWRARPAANLERLDFAEGQSR